MSNDSYVADDSVLELPPEKPPSGPALWMRENLFSSPASGVLTVVVGAFLLFSLRTLTQFVFGEGRDWAAVATNLRLLMTQAYPSAQYIRMWFAVGALIVLIGFSVAIWRTSGEVSVASLLRGVIGLGVIIAIAFLLANPAHSAIKWPLVILGVAMAAIGGAITTSQADRLRDAKVPALGVVLGVMVAALLAIWVVPFGRYAFVDGAVQPTVSGTIALSTRLPWLVMAILAISAYWVARAARDRLPESLSKTILSLAFVLSLPFLYFVVLRDPSWDYGQLLRTDLPILLFFVIVGGGLTYWAAKASGELGRIVTALVVIVAVALWFVPMLMTIRFLTILLAAFLMGAPTFAGEEAARRRYLIVWIATATISFYLMLSTNTPRTLQFDQAQFIGGLSLSFFVASSVILISFPIGVLLALGRTSSMPIFRILSTFYIEVMRGIPLITVLVFFNLMFPLFLPDDVGMDAVLSAIVGYSLFSGAYLAENVRGGLQAIRKGQYEAARALGMSTGQLTSFIVLPQALRAVIPALVGGVIATFKETSLLAVIGLFDLLYIANRVIPAQTEFRGARLEGLIFAAAVYWMFTFGISQASLRLEKKLGIGDR